MNGPPHAGVLPVPDTRAPAGYATYFGLVAVSFVLSATLRHLLDHNEADVLVAALHARDPSFIPGDWYLDLPIPYRDLYNLLAGSLAKALGLLPAAVVGRVVGVVCVSAALAPLLARLRVHPALVAPLFVLYQRYRSVVAEEWVVGSFETKTFAYAAVLGAMLAAHRRRWVAAAALAGLAVSCHVLVGTYAAATLTAALLLGRRDLAAPADDDGHRASPSRNLWLLPLVVGLVAATPGLVSIARMFEAASGVDRRAAGEIYVRLRVPHHTYPPHWGTPGSIARAVLSCAVLVLGVRAGRSPLTRFVARYALLSAAFAGVGFAVLAAGRVDLLKVYWFRFPDAMWPLGATLVAGALVSERVPGPRGRARVVAVAASCLVWATLVPAFARDARALAMSSRADPVYLRTMPAGVRGALLWVRDHAPADATVLVDPFLSRTHLATERAQVVSFKCVPQTDREILAWAARLGNLAGVRDLRDDDATGLRRLAAEAYRLPAETVARAARDFGASFYVAAADHALPYRVVYEGGGYRVYALDGPSGG
ncbi:MAG: hypothetical protein JNM10_09535 [Planctomycetia bacterium]|nr:hypothetical protein [Planctomycetia bacterium]